MFRDFIFLGNYRKIMFKLIEIQSYKDKIKIILIV